MNRIEKEFKDLDLDKVDLFSPRWYWGRGGLPLKDDEWFVTHLSEILQETRYKLPEFINYLLKSRYTDGQENVRNEIKKILNI